MPSKKLSLLIATALCLLACTAAVRAMQDEILSPRLAALQKELAAGNRAALENFWQGMTTNTAPLIEPIAVDDKFALVTFVYRGKDDVKNVLIFGGIAGTDVEKCRMANLANSDVWYKTFRVRKDARFTYAFSINDSLVSFDKLPLNDFKAMMQRISTFKADPLNPKKFPGFTPSLVEMPDAPAQTYHLEQANIKKGTVEKQRIKSAILNNERNIWVYTPPDYQTNGKPYGLLVVFDGFTYLSLVPTQHILDNLIAKNLIPPMVAVTVDNVSQAARGVELPCNPQFADFLAKELVPMLREKYNVSKDAQQTVVAGSSYGGLASAYAAFRHPEVFGNVLSQSGSYWWRPEGREDEEHEWLTKQFAASPKLSVRFYMDVGLMESDPTPGKGPSMVIANRHLREILKSKGYFVHYAEFNGGHEYVNWRGTLVDGLLALMGNKR
ncbi:MAG: enterochelin esterase [Acidobacteriota bacterium]